MNGLSDSKDHIRYNRTICVYTCCSQAGKVPLCFPTPTDTCCCSSQPHLALVENCLSVYVRVRFGEASRNQWPVQDRLATPHKVEVQLMQQQRTAFLARSPACS